MSDIKNFEGHKNDSYQLVNLRTGLRADQWSVTLFVENLEDKKYLSIGQTGSNGDYRFGRSVPRTAGISINYKM